MNGLKSLVISLGGLVISALVVHGVYTAWIIPSADAAILSASAQGVSAPRDIVVILKDIEQEICLIMMFWCMTLIAGQFLEVTRLGAYLKTNFAEHGHEEVYKFLSSDVQATKSNPLTYILYRALQRFKVDQNISDAHEFIRSGLENVALGLESGSNMIRYIIWAIPSIGFIGTVRGIGIALSEADKALEGDIAGMTDALGVAFNSTLVALFISIILMFLLHRLQRQQDKILLDTQQQCDDVMHTLEQDLVTPPAVVN